MELNSLRTSCSRSRPGIGLPSTLATTAGKMAFGAEAGAALSPSDDGVLPVGSGAVAADFGALAGVLAPAWEKHNPAQNSTHAGTAAFINDFTIFILSF